MLVHMYLICIEIISWGQNIHKLRHRLSAVLIKVTSTKKMLGRSVTALNVHYACNN